MKKIPLGSSDLEVSEICLGSMTWGIQNTMQDAHQQIEYALEQGVNFIDTAEIYPIPPNEETKGFTEQYIGKWLANNRHKRGQIVLATKVAGKNIPWIRGGDVITGEAVTKAIEGSLKQLQTDYIDLYQLHWPNRSTPNFGRHWPGMIEAHSIDAEVEQRSFLEVLQALGEAVSAGKIRHCGLSNETPWGIKEYLQLAKQHDLPKIVSVQNEFSLLHLSDWPYVIETCAADGLAYMPWSPMAGGALSGKYRNDARPEGCRWTMTQRNGLFRDTQQTDEAVEAYYQVAKKYNLSLAQMSLAWVYQFKGVTSTIIGSTSMDNLKENIEAYNVELSPELLDDIDEVIHQYPQPF